MFMRRRAPGSLLCLKRGMTPPDSRPRGHDEASFMHPERTIARSGADLVSTWVRKQMQGMPSASELVNPTGNQVNANDERFALAA